MTKSQLPGLNDFGGEYNNNIITIMAGGTINRKELIISAW